MIQIGSKWRHKGNNAWKPGDWEIIIKNVTQIESAIQSIVISYIKTPPSQNFLLGTAFEYYAYRAFLSEYEPMEQEPVKQEPIMEEGDRMFAFFKKRNHELPPWERSK